MNRPELSHPSCLPASIVLLSILVLATGCQHSATEDESPVDHKVSSCDEYPNKIYSLTTTAHLELIDEDASNGAIGRENLTVRVDPTLYEVPNGCTLDLTVQLQTPAALETAFFPEDAILWYEKEPSYLTIDRVIDAPIMTVRETNDNDTEENAKYPFRLQISFQDDIYYSDDPTIINLPPETSTP